MGKKISIEISFGDNFKNKRRLSDKKREKRSLEATSVLSKIKFSQIPKHGDNYKKEMIELHQRKDYDSNKALNKILKILEKEKISEHWFPEKSTISRVLVCHKEILEQIRKERKERKLRRMTIFGLILASISIIISTIIQIV